MNAFVFSVPAQFNADTGTNGYSLLFLVDV